MSRHRCETGWPFIHFPVDSPFCLRANEARGIMGGVIYLCPEYCIRWKQIDYICLMLFLLPRLLPRLHKSYWKNGVKLPVNSQTCHSSPCEQKQVTQGLLIDGLSERAGTNPVEWGAAWLQDKPESGRGRAGLEALSVYNFSLPTCLTRLEKINRSVCLKVRLLVSSLVEKFAADFSCFYKL